MERWLAYRQRCLPFNASVAKPELLTTRRSFDHLVSNPVARMCPKSSAGRAVARVSFDNFVGAAEEREWEGKAERLRGFEIDH
jgi:hypothetical protein